jgi:hypothetical protein
METNTTQIYCGWANYETWAVNLWLSNDGASYSHWTERTREILAESATAEDNCSAVGQLADELCEAIHDEYHTEGAGLVSDLLTAALSKVDWHEIAQSFIDDISPTSTRKVVPLGLVVATTGVLAELTDEDRLGALARHARGDWGDVNQEDWAENELSLNEGKRLLSAYHSAGGVKFWIITEADRSITTMLLPIEY